MAYVTINARLIYCDRAIGHPLARHVGVITFDLPWYNQVADPPSDVHFRNPVHMEWTCDGKGCEAVGFF